MPTGSRPAAAPGQVPIYVISNGDLASFVLRAAGVDWSEAFAASDFRRPPPPDVTRAFCMNTCTTADIRLSTALAARLSQGKAVMLVTFVPEPAVGHDARPLSPDAAVRRARRLHRGEIPAR